MYNAYFLPKNKPFFDILRNYFSIRVRASKAKHHYAKNALKSVYPPDFKTFNFFFWTLSCYCEPMLLMLNYSTPFDL